MSDIEKKAELLFEVSWEVCNKVGGINTVIKSKTSKILESYNDHDYIAVGPYFHDKATEEFEEVPTPKEFEKKCKELETEGIQIHFGKWLIKGSPFTILIDFNNYWYKLNEIKQKLWENFSISSIRSGYDYDEPLVWSYAVGRVIQCLANNKKTVVQCHEWLSGVTLLYLKINKVKISTVFTTHATILGRTLSSNNVNLYAVLDKINPDQEAYKYNIEAKHSVEKQSAINSDIFTTVSEITGIEAEKLLGRKPDVILPNGLDIQKFPTFEELSVQHNIFKNKIKEFLKYYFFPYYPLDLDNTLIYFLAGRYEYRDKGIDVFINSLSKLNAMMKKSKSKKNIVAFIWVPANAQSIDPHLLQNKAIYDEIQHSINDNNTSIKNKIMNNLLSNKNINEKSIFSESFLFETKKRLKRFKKVGTPELSTHHLYDKNDQIVKTLYSSGLDNMEDDPVKVIFYPIYLTGSDGLLDLTYYECMQGSHLGVFPSFYEPWGYTPLEAAALGVSSVTTDLAGFGRHIYKECVDKEIPGVFVLKRDKKTDQQITDSLAKFMFKFSKFSKQDRVKNKLIARNMAAKADWKFLIDNYIIAHNKAFDKTYK